MLDKVVRNQTSGQSDDFSTWLRWPISRGDATALIYEASPGILGELTWQQLACRVLELTESIRLAGFEPGDRLIHANGNSLAGVCIALASLACGVIEVPIDPASNAAGISTLIERTGAHWFFIQDSESRNPRYDAARQLAKLCRDNDPDRPALLLSTSGTAGVPRIVTLSQRNLSSNALAKLNAVPQSTEDVRITLLPICHAYARTCDLGTWLLSGCRLAITSGWTGWKRVAPQVFPTLVNTVPSLAKRLVEEPSGLPETGKLRVVGCGGAALPAATFERYRTRGITLIQGYGLTEASPVVCSANPSNARAGVVGQPVLGCQTRVDGAGRLWVRGKGVMLGYWNDPAATSQRIVDGWLDTGDIVEIDAIDGQYRILGRIDDRITLSNGRKIDPAMIEQRLYGLDGVHHVFVVPADRHIEVWLDVRPDLRNRRDWASCIQKCLPDLPAWQIPRRVVVLNRALTELPETLTAKGTPIRKEVVRIFGGQ